MTVLHIYVPSGSLSSNIILKFAPTAGAKHKNGIYIKSIELTIGSLLKYTNQRE